jgi:hypothetical protein
MADAITGVSNGGSVASWRDSSGHAHPFTATTDPTYVTNDQNGLPAVRFAAASSQHMGVTGYAPGNVTSPFDVSIFVVLNVASYASVGVILSTRAGGEGWTLSAQASQAGYQWGYTGGTSNPYTTSTGAWHLVEVIQAGTSAQVGVDGTLGSAVTMTGWTASTGGLLLGIGSANPLAADVGEVLLYTSTVSSRAAIETYLINKWALP